MPKNVFVRLPDDMVEAIERIAEEEGRSVSNLIRMVLKDWLDKKDSDSA